MYAFTDAEKTKPNKPNLSLPKGDQTQSCPPKHQRRRIKANCPAARRQPTKAKRRLPKSVGLTKGKPYYFSFIRSCFAGALRRGELSRRAVRTAANAKAAVSTRRTVLVSRTNFALRFFKRVFSPSVIPPSGPMTAITSFGHRRPAKRRKPRKIPAGTAWPLRLLYFAIVHQPSGSSAV